VYVSQLSYNNSIVGKLTTKCISARRVVPRRIEAPKNPFKFIGRPISVGVRTGQRELVSVPYCMRLN